ncbi:EAL domain-containing protein [Halomonas sp. Bachu 37]|uniref:putative bifunctional diguanylate cyclase/phosphodiesterase n=1 Tax=Halomonas kashgarensis TaxID=3084920 RepID=UPI00321755F3
MDVNNRELALQAGLLILLVSALIIGAGGLAFSIFPIPAQPPLLTLMADSALVVLVGGLGLSAVMAELTLGRRLAAVVIAIIGGYTLLHHLTSNATQIGLSWLTGQPRLPVYALPTLGLAAICLWAGPQGKYQNLLYKMGGGVMWLIGCTTLAHYAGYTLPTWMPRSSTPLAGLFTFAFGIAMVMLSRRIPQSQISLGKKAVLAGILGIFLSTSGWFLISWNQYQNDRGGASPQALTSDAWSLSSLLPVGIGLGGILLTYQLIFSLGLMASRKARTRELAQANDSLEDQHRIQSMIAQEVPYTSVLLQVCRMLEHQLEEAYVAIWLGNSAPSREGLELISLSLPSAFRALRHCPGTAFKETTEPMHIADLRKETRWAEFCELAQRHGFLAAHTYPVHGRVHRHLGAVMLFFAQPRGATRDQDTVVATATRLISLTFEHHMRRQALQDSEQRFRSLFTHNPDAVFSLDRTGTFLSVNQATVDLLGTSQAQLLGRTYTEIVEPNQLPRMIEAFDKAKRGVPQRFEITWQCPSGILHPIDISFLPTLVDDSVVGVYGVAKDMSELRASEAQLRIFQRSLEASSNGVLIAEAKAPDYAIVYSNPAFTAITGYSQADALGRNCHFLRGPDTNSRQIGLIAEAMANERDINLTIRHYCKDGRAFWNNIFISPVRNADGAVTHFVGIINDISERKEQENQLAYHATHDALTGLGNRALFEDRLRHDVALARRHAQQLAVLFIDLDEFKPINDTLGHAVGDQVLVNVASRLKEAIRPTDTLCRFGGDEFVLLLPDLVSPQQAEDIAQRLLIDIARPYRIDAHELYLSASIGIALSDDVLEHPETLLQQADMAMYKAKKQGRNATQSFSHEITEKLSQRVTLRNDLQEAIDQGQFALHYQPLITRDNEVEGFEALVRWNHPSKGFISPGLFIPIAEETGQIIPLSQWVMERAARDFMSLKHLQLADDCRMAINLSPLQFHRPSFLSTLHQALETTGLAPESLELELTEGILMNDTDSAIDTLHALRGMGVSVAIDDFGTGFSSLSYLRHLPVDKIKIDRSFILDMADNDKDAAVVQGIIALAHHLDLTVVAEGVETCRQREYLTSLECDVFQGYLFARPMPLGELNQWLEAHRLTS